MNQVTELVDLPDPAVQSLVHPLDLAEARRAFRKSWMVGILTSPAVSLCIAALVWFASGSYIVALIVAAVHVGFGALARRFFLDEAWAFIPRKRQDRQRLLPPRWDLVSGLVFAVVLSAALLLALLRLEHSDIHPSLREFAFGTASAVAVLVLLDFGHQLLAHDPSGRRRALFMLPVVVAVIGCTVLAYAVLFGSASPGLSSPVVWGFGIMLAVGVVVGVWDYVGGRAGTYHNDLR